MPKGSKKKVTSPAKPTASPNETQTTEGPAVATVSGVTLIPEAIYRYNASLALYVSSWSRRPGAHRLAIASFVETPENKIFFVKADEELKQLNEIGSFHISHPPTNVQWIPDDSGQFRELVIVSGDHLRLLSVNEDGASVTEEAMLHHDLPRATLVPYSSFDWCEVDPSFVATSCMDGTCIMWNIENHRQVNATEPSTSYRWLTKNVHVFDVGFSRMGTGKNVLVTANNDGTIRMFDVRGGKKHSRVLFEAYSRRPFIRVVCNQVKDYLMAAFARDSDTFLIFDARRPGNVCMRFSNDERSLMGAMWMPDSADLICGIGDNYAYQWNIKSPEQPAMKYEVPNAVSSISCSPLHPDLLAIGYANSTEIVKIWNTL